MFENTTLTGLIRGIFRIALPLLALFVGVSSFNHLRSSKPVPPKPLKKEVVQPVRTQAVKLGSHQPQLRLYGEIVSGRKVELRALVAGKVVKTGAHFREGARVEKGELLLKIDPFAYEGAVVEARARIVEAQARLKEIRVQIRAEEDAIRHARRQLTLAERDLERANRLVRRGNVTQQGADQRELTVSQRRQTLDGKLASLAILKARAEQQVAGIESLDWRLRQAQRHLQDTELKAPFAGYLSELNADTGKLLNVNDRVARLLDAGWMDVVFTLSDRQFGRLQNGPDGVVGRPVTVIWQLGETPVRYRAVVERVGALISSETGGVTVYARLETPPSSRAIRPGAFVDVHVPDRTYHKVARLPQTALYGRNRVYVVGPEARLVERKVVLRAIDGESVLVSGDLADGERVVVTRMSTIGAGMKVLDLPERPVPAAKTGPKGKKSRGGAAVPPGERSNRG